MFYSLFTSFYPNTTNKQNFTYDYIESEKYLLGVNEKNHPLFKTISKDKFDEQKDLLFAIAAKDEQTEHPRRVLTSLVFIFLYYIIFVVHNHLRKRVNQVIR